MLMIQGCDKNTNTDTDTDCEYKSEMLTLTFVSAFLEPSYDGSIR